MRGSADPSATPAGCPTALEPIGQVPFEPERRPDKGEEPGEAVRPPAAPGQEAQGRVMGSGCVVCGSASISNPELGECIPERAITHHTTRPPGSPPGGARRAVSPVPGPGHPGSARSCSHPAPCPADRPPRVRWHAAAAEHVPAARADEGPPPVWRMPGHRTAEPDRAGGMKACC